MFCSIGQNRAFQEGDGWCICKPTYVFVDPTTFQASSDNDGVYDCQPMVYTTCAPPTVRSAAGVCVDSVTYCNGVCGAGGGTLSSTTGTCTCNNITRLDAVCDADCRASAPSMSCDSSGNIVVVDPSTGEKTIVPPSSLQNAQGAISCSAANVGSQILAMTALGGEFGGIFSMKCFDNAKF